MAPQCRLSPIERVCVQGSADVDAFSGAHFCRARAVGFTIFIVSSSVPGATQEFRNPATNGTKTRPTASRAIDLADALEGGTPHIELKGVALIARLERSTALIEQRIDVLPVLECLP